MERRGEPPAHSGQLIGQALLGPAGQSAVGHLEDTDEGARTQPLLALHGAGDLPLAQGAGSPAQGAPERCSEADTVITVTPLEPMLFVSLTVAIVALCIWFFFIAENPPHQVI